MGRVRLEVHVLPWNWKDSSLAQSRPGATKQFLEVCDENLTLEDLCLKLISRYARIYRGQGPLKIDRLLDDRNSLLDLSFTVGDIFDDKGNGSDASTSIVKVVPFAPDVQDLSRHQRFGSILPESSARPQKRSFGNHDHAIARGFGDLADLGSWAAEQHQGTNKRQRIHETKVNECLDPDRPVRSREGLQEQFINGHLLFGTLPDEIIEDSQPMLSRKPIPNSYGTPTSLSHSSPHAAVPSSHFDVEEIPDTPPRRYEDSPPPSGFAADDTKAESLDTEIPIQDVPSSSSRAPSVELLPQVIPLPNMTPSLAVPATTQHGTSSRLLPKGLEKKRTDILNQQTPKHSKVVQSPNGKLVRPKRRLISTSPQETFSSAQRSTFDPPDTDIESSQEQQRSCTPKRRKLDYQSAEKSCLSSSLYETRQHDTFQQSPLPVTSCSQGIVVAASDPRSLAEETLGQSSKSAIDVAEILFAGSHISPKSADTNALIDSRSTPREVSMDQTIPHMMGPEYRAESELLVEQQKLDCKSNDTQTLEVMNGVHPDLAGSFQHQSGHAHGTSATENLGTALPINRKIWDMDSRKGQEENVKVDLTPRKGAPKEQEQRARDQREEIRRQKQEEERAENQQKIQVKKATEEQRTRKRKAKVEKIAEQKKMKEEQRAQKKAEDLEKVGSIANKASDVTAGAVASPEQMVQQRAEQEKQEGSFKNSSQQSSALSLRLDGHEGKERSLTPAFPGSSDTKSRPVDQATSGRSRDTSSSPSRLSVQPPIKSALRQSPSTLRRSVSFANDPIIFSEYHEPVSAMATKSAVNKGPLLGPSSRKKKDDLVVQKSLSLERSLYISSDGAPTELTPREKSETPKKRESIDKSELLKKSDLAKKSVSPKMVTVKKTGKVQTKLNVKRDVKLKGRVIEPPLPPKPVPKEEIVISSDSDKSLTSYYSESDEEPQHGSAKAGPSSRKKPIFVGKPATTTAIAESDPPPPSFPLKRPVVQQRVQVVIPSVSRSGQRAASSATSQSHPSSCSSRSPARYMASEHSPGSGSVSASDDLEIVENQFSSETNHSPHSTSQRKPINLTNNAERDGKDSSKQANSRATSHSSSAVSAKSHGRIASEESIAGSSGNGVSQQLRLEHRQSVDRTQAEKNLLIGLATQSVPPKANSLTKPGSIDTISDRSPPQSAYMRFPTLTELKRRSAEDIERQKSVVKPPEQKNANSQSQDISESDSSSSDSDDDDSSSDSADSESKAGQSGSQSNEKPKSRPLSGMKQLLKSMFFGSSQT